MNTYSIDLKKIYEMIATHWPIVRILVIVVYDNQFSQWARAEQEELILFVYFYSNAELVAAANDMMSTHHAKLDK